MKLNAEKKNLLFRGVKYVLLIEYDFPIGTHIDHSTTAHGMSSILIPKDFVDSSLDVTPHGMLLEVIVYHQNKKKEKVKQTSILSRL
jgi:hypothetical protein